MIPKTEEAWRQLFRKRMGKDSAGNELAQFKRNFQAPLSFKDEQALADKETKVDHKEDS